MIDRKQFEEILTKRIDENVKSGFQYWDYDSDGFDDRRMEVLGVVVTETWDRILSKCGGYRSDRPLMLMEDGLAELVRRGVDRKKILIRGGAFRSVPLACWTYFVEKGGRSTSVCPADGNNSNWHSHQYMRWITLTPKDFADFILEFDSLIPEITARVDGKLLEIRKMMMGMTVLRRTVSELAEQYLTPHHISCTMSDFDEEKVVLTFSRRGRKDLSRTVPITDLQTEIEKIPEEMRQ